MTNEVSADISIESHERGRARVPFSLSSWFTALIVRTVVLTLARDLQQIAHNRISRNYREKEKTIVKLSRTEKGVTAYRYVLYNRIKVLNGPLRVAIEDWSDELEVYVNRKQL